MSDTTVSAYGATLERFDNVTAYGTTGSMSALFITNSNIRILGGTHNGKSTLPSWSGAILIEGGTNITIRNDAIFPPHWSGIFGHTRNSVYSTAASVSQSTGIGISGTRVRIFDNLAYGHSGLQVTTPNVNGDTGGKSIIHSIDAAHQPTPAIAFALAVGERIREYLIGRTGGSISFSDFRSSY